MRTLFVHIFTALSKTQLRQIVAAGMTAMLLLVSPVALPLASASIDSGVQDRLEALEAKGETGRPRTTGQFREEKAALEGQPGKLLRNTN